MKYIAIFSTVKLCSCDPLAAYIMHTMNVNEVRIFIEHFEEEYRIESDF